MISGCPLNPTTTGSTTARSPGASPRRAMRPMPPPSRSSTAASRRACGSTDCVGGESKKAQILFVAGWEF